MFDREETTPVNAVTGSGVLLIRIVSWDRDMRGIIQAARRNRNSSSAKPA